MKPNLRGFFPEELRELSKKIGEQAFRAKQLWNWLQVRGAVKWEEMSNLPSTFREKWAMDYSISIGDCLEVAGDVQATQKLLLRLEDGESIETVLLPSRDRHTVCLSTQVGCRMGCVFCASGKCGFARNLQAGEIVGQVFHAIRHWGTRPNNIVLMGMGEPLDNYDESLRAIRILNHPDGLQIGARRITLSTCGVIPGIHRLATEGLQIELSVSLHAPNSEIRRRLMPVDNKWPMDDLLATCEEYTRATKRIITFEYTLVKGMNDAREHAVELGRRLSRFPSRVNLIPLSPVDEFMGETPPRPRMIEFQNVLARAGINVTLRDSKGKSVDAACGQLRRRRYPVSSE